MEMLVWQIKSTMSRQSKIKAADSHTVYITDSYLFTSSENQFGVERKTLYVTVLSFGTVTFSFLEL